MGALAAAAGVEVAAGAFAAAAGAEVGAEVAAGVLAVTGAGGGCVEAGGVATAGALPALVALVAPAAADVAFSELAVFGADFAAGAGVGAGVAVAAAAALVPTAGIAVAYALNGAANVRLAQPSATAAHSAARPALGEEILAASDSGCIGRFDRSAVTTAFSRTGFSRARCAAEAACRAVPARYTQ